MMEQIYSLYNQFLSMFPQNLQWAASVTLAILLVYAIYQTLKKNFIWIILLLILLPASVPILKNIWESAFDLVQFLITKK